MTDRSEDPQAGDAVAGQVREVLGSVQEHALQLLARFDRPPDSLRISAGGVTVEARWPAHGGPGPASPQPLPAPATTAVDAPLATPAAPGRPGTAAGPAPAGTAPGGAPADGRRYLCSPMVGVFYQAPGPGAKPFVTPGDTAVDGQQVAIVEAMKLMIPVRAEGTVTILEQLKQDGDPVEYGDPLFAVAPLGR